MRTFAIDWGHGDKLVVCYEGPHGPITRQPLLTVEELLPTLPRPCRVVIESTWSSWDKQQKNREILLAEALGIDLRTVKPKQTYRYREEHGIAKTDDNDAVAIYLISTTTNIHLARPRKAPFKERTLTERLNEARRTQKPEALEAEFFPFLPTRTKRSGAKEFALPAWVKAALGDSFGILAQLVATARETVELDDGTRKTFDMRIGCHGSGFENINRSNLYYFRVRSLLKQRLAAEGVALPEDRSDFTPEHWALLRKMRKPLMRAVRKAARWVFHRVKEAYPQVCNRPGTTVPATGTHLPVDCANLGAGHQCSRNGHLPSRPSFFRPPGTNVPATGTDLPAAGTYSGAGHLLSRPSFFRPPGTNVPATGTRLPAAGTYSGAGYLPSRPSFFRPPGTPVPATGTSLPAAGTYS